MNGAIATILKDKEQVGGLLDWELRLVRTKGSDGENKTEQVVNWLGSARRFWYFTEVEMPVKILFYKFDDGTLYRVDEKVCQIGFTGDKDTVNTGPIELESWIAS